MPEGHGGSGASGRGFESRRVPRVAVNTTARFAIAPAMRAQVGLVERHLEGRLIDISTLGVGLTCPFFLPKGTKIHVKFLHSAIAEPSAKGEIAFVGHVANARMMSGKSGYRLGVEFSHISKRNVGLIETYVRKNLS